MMNKTNGLVERDSSVESARAARVKAAAARAKAEAESRHLQAAAPDLPPELHGRDGLEPVRYGDWEVRGLATDF